MKEAPPVKTHTVTAVLVYLPDLRMRLRRKC